MVVSKTGDRYRLQSDCFEAIGLLEAELVKRLSEYYHDKVNPTQSSHVHAELHWCVYRILHSSTEM